MSVRTRAPGILAMAVTSFSILASLLACPGLAVKRFLTMIMKASCFTYNIHSARRNRMRQTRRTLLKGALAAAAPVWAQNTPRQPLYAYVGCYTTAARRA